MSLGIYLRKVPVASVARYLWGLGNYTRDSS